MPLPTETIVCDVTLATGAEFEAGRASIVFKLDKPDWDTVANEAIPANELRFTLDADGQATVTLWPNDRGNVGSVYQVWVEEASSQFGRGIVQPTKYPVIRVVAGGGPYNLTALFDLSAPPAPFRVVSFLTQAEYDAAIAAGAQAAASATSAAASAAVAGDLTERLVAADFADLSRFVLSAPAAGQTVVTAGDIVSVLTTGAVYEVVGSGGDFQNANGVRLLALPRDGFITPLMLGAVGAGDDRVALLRWLSAVSDASGRVGWIDRDYSFATTIVHSGPARIRGPYSNSARLIYTGTGDGLELTGAVDIDGVIVDGNLDPDAIPTATSEAGCLLGIHGPMTGAPGYLANVKIGRLRVQNTRRRCALALVNLSEFEIERIEAEGTFGNAFHMAGLQNGQIGGYRFDRVGNLAAEASRLGAGIAFYAEGDAGKQPATWYVVAGVQPTDNVDFGPGQGSRTTDTSIYLHDTYGSGVKNVQFAHYQGTLIGKDGVKFRDGASNCRMSSCQLSKVGLRFAVIEDAGSDDNAILNVDGDQAGYDVIGEWLDGAPGTRNFTTAANGLNQTLNQTPGGLRMNGVARGTITGIARRVLDAPHNAAEGHGVSFIDCADSTMVAQIEDCDGHARIRGLTRCLVNVDATNVARNGQSSNVTAAVYCDDSADQSADNVVSVVSRETSGAAVLNHPLRINGTGTGWDAQVSMIGPHALPGGIVTRSDSAGFAHYRNNPTISGRGSVAFDGSATGTITHNAGTTPAFLASHEGGFSYFPRVNALAANTATIILIDVATGATVPSVTRTISWSATRLRQAQGFTW
jgi:hypothetical protein